MRGRAASCKASQARSMSSLIGRARSPGVDGKAGFRRSLARYFEVTCKADGGIRVPSSSAISSWRANQLDITAPGKSLARLPRDRAFTLFSPPPTFIFNTSCTRRARKSLKMISWSVAPAPSQVPGRGVLSSRRRRPPNRNYPRIECCHAPWKAGATVLRPARHRAFAWSRITSRCFRERPDSRTGMDKVTLEHAHGTTIWAMAVANTWREFASAPPRWNATINGIGGRAATRHWKKVA